MKTQRGALGLLRALGFDVYLEDGQLTADYPESLSLPGAVQWIHDHYRELYADLIPGGTFRPVVLKLMHPTPPGDAP